MANRKRNQPNIILIEDPPKPPSYAEAIAVIAAYHIEMAKQAYEGMKFDPEGAAEFINDMIGRDELIDEVMTEVKKQLSKKK